MLNFVRKDFRTRQVVTNVTTIERERTAALTAKRLLVDHFTSVEKIEEGEHGDGALDLEEFRNFMEIPGVRSCVWTSASVLPTLVIRATKALVHRRLDAFRMLLPCFLAIGGRVL